ncbi:MAG: DEAD/DEAH box helicase, partial [Phycisphaerales bacterium]
MSFLDLRLAEPIVRAVAAEGYTSPTPIQAQAIPVALEGRDVLGCAQTGTGKTCAFALPILHRLANLDENGKARKGAQGRAPRALVLCPTRELASQIFDSFASYGRFLPLRHTVVFGGVNQHRQVQALRAGVDVLVATPGRLLDLLNQGVVDLRSVEVLVLDEADRMLDMGFIHDIRKVVKMISPQRQSLLFSATISPEIRKLADSILQNPVSVQTAREAETADAVAQHVYMVDRQNKPLLLERLLNQSEVGRTLVFTRTKHGADKLVKTLRRASINADAIHGNKSQNARTKAMRDFRSGHTTVLVATDIASRGIDVDEITHVVNYDMPVDSETYVHRIGRTARAGATGIAISLCDRDEIKILRAIEKRTRLNLEIQSDHEDLTINTPIDTRSERPARKPFFKGK